MCTDKGETDKDGGREGGRAIVLWPGQFVDRNTADNSHRQGEIIDMDERVLSLPASVRVGPFNYAHLHSHGTGRISVSLSQDL